MLYFTIYQVEGGRGKEAGEVMNPEFQCDAINCSERNWRCSDLQFDSGAITSAVGLLILKSETQYQPRLDIKMSMEK